MKGQKLSVVMEFIFNKNHLVLLALISLLTTDNQAQTFQDIDGNVYNTVIIGSQVWMKENLKVTHYRNGDSIPEIQDSVLWVNQMQGAWCNNENKASNGIVYGRLYNWHVVSDSRGIAPMGWRVPTDDDWKKLEMYLGMSEATANRDNYRGDKEANALKVADTTTYWTLECCPAPGLSKNKGNNSSGFSAIGSGYRLYFNAGGQYTSFQIPTGNAQFWTSTSFGDTKAWLRHLCVYHEDIYRAALSKANGSSIRLIKDDASSSNDLLYDNLELNMYPNPTKDKLLIQCNQLQMQVQFHSLTGKFILETDLAKGINVINVTSLSKGVYILRFTNQNTSVIRKPVIE